MFYVITLTGARGAVKLQCMSDAAAPSRKPRDAYHHGGLRDALVDALSLFGIGYSWGGYESLALGSHPERDRDVMPWPPRGTAPENRHAVRLWIGLEDPDDLIADLDRGLAAWSAA